MQTKPYKTAKQHIEILEKRGLAFRDKERAERFLLREGYYAVVNGYKDAFIDKQATNLANDDRYRQGLPFEYFELVYDFDSTLRRITMDALLKAENAMRTATVDAFCLYHPNHDDYLDPACYRKKSDYKPTDKYTSGLIKLLSTLQAVHDNKHRKEYIRHYLDAYRCLPLWVASKCLTFGNMSAFFDFQQQSVQNRACINLSTALAKEKVRMRDMRFAYHTLPDFRNLCAHDERLYCTKLGKNGDKGFSELLKALKPMMTESEFKEYVALVVQLIDATGKNDLTLKGELLSGLGIDYDELEALAK